ncbi:MAG: flagellar hook capping FlgD N-terminal domain-containing protein, partial [Pirellulales bacterium]
MQNQDPLNPMDNSEMLAQINQLRQIGSTDKLTSTLDSVLLGQNITSSTNLIGKDIQAISDDNQKVAGTVSRVSIEDGQPKLHLDLAMKANPSIEAGDVGRGKYAYRIVWQGENGQLEGIELSGNDAVSTESDVNNYNSIQLRNMPITATAKQIYRTDATGEGDYRLVGILTDGKQSSYLDKTADAARSETRQTGTFYSDPSFYNRSFKISLNNVSEVVNSGS